MSSTETPQAPALTITNHGTTPTKPRKLFVNIPVSDVQRSITFFEALGFTFNRHFTDAQGTCMLVGEDAYFMLLTTARWEGFSHGVTATDPRVSAEALFTFSVESREAVDAIVKAAVDAGGSVLGEPDDKGFMYDWSFRDLDGHGWGVFWMDPSAIPHE